MGAPALSRVTLGRSADIWLTTIGAISAVAVAVTAAGLGDAARSGLGFSFPAHDDWQDFATVLWRNGTLAVAALIVARARLGQFMLAVGWAVNVGLAGAALAAYGSRLIAHAALYGLIELAGFAVVLAIVVRIRREGGRPEGGELLLALALLVVAALCETVWAWRP